MKDNSRASFQGTHLSSQQTLKELTDQFESAWRLRQDDLEQSMAMAEAAQAQVAEANLLHEEKQFCDCCFKLIFAYYHMSKGQLLEGLPAALDAYTVFQNSGSFAWLSRTHNILGSLYIQLGNRPLALEHWLSYAKLAEAHGSEAETARAYHNVGWIPFQAEEYDKAAPYFERSLPIISQAGNPHHWALNLCNLATCRIHQNRLIEANILLQQAVTVCNTHDLIIEYNVTLQRFGLLAEKEGNLGKAIQYYLQSLVITEQHPDPFSRIPNLQAIGRLYLQLDQYQDAGRYLLEALRNSENAERKHFLYESHHLLSKLYQATGDLEKTIHHLQLYNQVRAEVFDEVSERNVHNLRIIHQTEVIRKEAAFLKSQNEILEAMVAERTKKLTKLLEEREKITQNLMRVLKREEELNELKSRIIETVSHEFRTPLTIIKTASDLIKYHAKMPQGAKGQKYFQRIDEAVHSIVNLLTGIDFVNATTGDEKLIVKPTKHLFNGLCGQIKKKTLVEYNGQGKLVFKYDRHNDQTLCVDICYLTQVVQNLLSNALKYGGRHAPIEIGFNLDRDCFKITVSDQGIGIPADEQEAIFDLFHRARNVQTERGLGLGLFMARKLTHLMGGTVTAVSAGVDRGSTFTITIPANSYPYKPLKR